MILNISTSQCAPNVAGTLQGGWWHEPANDIDIEAVGWPHLSLSRDHAVCGSLKVSVTKLQWSFNHPGSPPLYLPNDMNTARRVTLGFLGVVLQVIAVEAKRGGGGGGSKSKGKPEG